MSFSDAQLDSLLPSYLTQTDKGRIGKGLSQFFNSNSSDIRYENFYLHSPPDYFLQADLIESLPFIEWNTDKQEYVTGFSPVMIISNSCDLQLNHEHLVAKQGLFAPVAPMEEYLDDLRNNGLEEVKISSISNNLKNQLYSNIFYLPPCPPDGIEFIVFLDRIMWHPVKEFNRKLSEIDTERYVSLDNFGYYLFITKLSYHFCRVPEELERTNTRRSVI